MMQQAKESKGVAGVPDYQYTEYAQKQHDVCLLIPVINEGERILAELSRAAAAAISDDVDIILCDGGSTDDSTQDAQMMALGVNALLVKTGAGKQGAQLRTGLHFALGRGYAGILTIDGNNKDSIESVPLFLKKLQDGYDLIQGSRFIKGGVAENTPWVRWLAVRLLHAPVISLTARHWFTDTTNAYRAYSASYLRHPQVQPFRDVFTGYELLAYLSVRATQLGLRACEVPVARRYPHGIAAPTKIKGIKGNSNLLKILFSNLLGAYNP